MKEKQVFKILFLTTLIMLLIGAGANIVSAKAVGDDITIQGYNLGWILLILGVIIGLIFILGKSTKILNAKATKILVIPAVLLLIFGAFFAFVQYEPAATTAEITSGCPKFEITATPVITGNNYIGGTTGKADPQWDKDNLIYTIPIDVDSAANGRLNESITALNFTLDPLSTSTMTSDVMATIHMSSDYDIQYDGEDIFKKTNNYYCVDWTSSAGTNSYEKSQDMQVSDTSYALCTWQFDNNTASNWVSELDAIGDSFSFYVKFWNDCYSWSETVTVTVIVVEYTA